MYQGFWQETSSIVVAPTVLRAAFPAAGKHVNSCLGAGPPNNRPAVAATPIYCQGAANHDVN
jgi:hypothetical protein